MLVALPGQTHVLIFLLIGEKLLKSRVCEMETVSNYDEDIPQSHTADQPWDTPRKEKHSTNSHEPSRGK